LHLTVVIDQLYHALHAMVLKISTFFGFAAGYLAANFIRNLNDSTLLIKQYRILSVSDEPRSSNDQITKNVKTREIHVDSMCRCPSGDLPNSTTIAQIGNDTRITQPASMATGMQHSKHFIMHRSLDCECIKNSHHATKSPDNFLSKYLKHRIDDKEYCPNHHPSNFTWDQMPDFGVEQDLPLFIGVLSYESPQSLAAALENWRETDLFQKSRAQKIFVQLNHRSSQDDEVIQKFQYKFPKNDSIVPLGSLVENINVGSAIGKFCRKAEIISNSPDNRLLFLEKDWHVTNNARDVLSSIFRSLNALSQRGVPIIRLMDPLPEVRRKASIKWNCPALGIPWICTLAHQQRWANFPSVIDCNWYLRYLEPFALMDDSIMYGCRRGFQDSRYFDWEEAMQDGRIAWSESQWVIANAPSNMSVHDQ